MLARISLHLALLTSVFSISLGTFQIAHANKIEMAVRPWSYSAFDVTGTQSGCKLSSEFDGGSEVTFIAWNNNLQAMKIRMSNPVFNQGNKAPSKALIGFAGNNYFEADAAIEDRYTVTVALKEAETLIQSLYSSLIMTFEMGGKKSGYSLGGAANQLKYFAACNRNSPSQSDALHRGANIQPAYETRNVYTVSDGEPDQVAEERSHFLKPKRVASTNQTVQSLTINPFPKAKEGKDIVPSGETAQDLDAAFDAIAGVDQVGQPNKNRAEKQVVQLARMSEDPYDLNAGDQSAQATEKTKNHSNLIKNLTSSGANVPEVGEALHVSAMSDKNGGIHWRSGRVRSSVVRPVQVRADEIYASQMKGSMDVAAQNMQISFSSQGINADQAQPKASVSPVHEAVATKASPPPSSAVVASVHELEKREDVPTLVRRNAVPEEEWRVKSGDSLRKILAMWSIDQNVELVWDSNREFEIPAGAAFGESFEEAVAGTLHQYSTRSGAERPIGELYVDPNSGKKVLIIKTENRSAAGF